MTQAAVTLIEQAELSNRNSLRIGARAECLALVHDAQALPGLLDDPRFSNKPVKVLGGGSNVLITGDIEGLLLHLATQGRRIIEADGGRVQVVVAAGENWHELVLWTLRQGLVGLENLSLIPSSVGAAPIQNIGAYGVELSECLHAVTAFDRERRAWVELDHAACAFGYRDSVFKQQPGRFVLTEVTLALTRNRPLTIDYAGIRTELDAMAVATPDANAVSEAVIRLRRRKLPDPAQLPNAGSFFKNPLVAAAPAATLVQHHPSLPHWPMPDGRVKLSAGWLIETTGLRGYRCGDAGVAPGHALVLVNHGTASGADILTLAQHIQQRVAERFGVSLETEPVLL